MGKRRSLKIKRNFKNYLIDMDGPHYILIITSFNTFNTLVLKEKMKPLEKYYTN